MQCEKKILFFVVATLLMLGCQAQTETSLQHESSTKRDTAIAEKNIEHDDDLPPPIPEDNDEDDKQDKRLQILPSTARHDELPPAIPEEADDSSDSKQLLSLPTLPNEGEVDNGVKKAASTETLDESSHPKELLGLWRVFSSRLFYDVGGSGVVGSGTGHPLEINKDGTWQLSTSAGTWKVQSINEDDWKTWNVPSYGPKRKIVLDKWNGGTGNGPIEESNDGVDFFWIIYRAEPPIVSSSGQVQAKYGHAN